MSPNLKILNLLSALVCLDGFSPFELCTETSDQGGSVAGFFFKAERMVLMNCRKCGADVEEGVSICSKCRQGLIIESKKRRDEVLKSRRPAHSVVSRLLLIGLCFTIGIVGVALSIFLLHPSHDLEAAFVTSIVVMILLVMLYTDVVLFVERFLADPTGLIPFYVILIDYPGRVVRPIIINIISGILLYLMAYFFADKLSLVFGVSIVVR